MQYKLIHLFLDMIIVFSCVVSQMQLIFFRIIFQVTLMAYDLTVFPPRPKVTTEPLLEEFFNCYCCTPEINTDFTELLLSCALVVYMFFKISMIRR